MTRTLAPWRKGDTQRRDRSTRERLLDTAATLFWKRGYASTSIREIAATVGIRPSALYYYVQRKEDLLHQLCVTSMEHLLRDAQAAVGCHIDPLERLRSLIGAHLNTLVKHQIRHIAMLTGRRRLSAAFPRTAESRQSAKKGRR